MEIKRGLTQEPDLFAIKQKAKRRGPEFIGKPLRRVLKQADLNCGMSTNAILSSVVRARSVREGGEQFNLNYMTACACEC